MFHGIRAKILSYPYSLILLLVGICAGLCAGILGEVFMFLTARPASPYTGIKDIIVMIDSSGSMASNNKISRVADAFAAFVNAVDLSQDRIGLIAFSSEAEILSGFTSNRESLISAAQNLIPAGETNMGSAFFKAQELFLQKRENAAQK